MATEDLLPLFHTDGGGVKSPEVDLETLLAQDSTLQDDQLLSEILGSEGVRGLGGREIVSDHSWVFCLVALGPQIVTVHDCQ